MTQPRRTGDLMSIFTNTICGVTALGALLATTAQATTVDFAYLSGASTVASGSFRYDDAATGVLNYADLTAFTITVAATTYTLADVLTYTDYVHFGYDTSANTFVTSGNLTGFAGPGYFSSLSAISSGGTAGFYFTALPSGFFQEYTTSSNASFDSATFTASNGIPEPASWAMLIAGFGLVGAAMRRRAAVTA